MVGGRHRLEPPLPSKREEEQLFSAYVKTRSDELRNVIVEAYIPLAQAIARREKVRLPPMVDIGDLYSGAYQGLMWAVESFDPSRTIRFTTYAPRRIRGGILDEIRREDVINHNRRHYLSHAKKIYEAIMHILQRPPTKEEVLARLPKDQQSFVSSHFNALNGKHFDRLFSEITDEEEATVDNLVRTTTNPQPNSGYQMMMDEVFDKVYQLLTKQERRVIYQYYWEDLSFREIGENEQLTESYICIIHGNILKKLREKRILRDGLEQVLAASAA